MDDRTQKVKNFLDTIFSGKDADEHILIFSSNTPRPGYPIDSENFLERRPPNNKACFFSTMTAVPDAEGKLYHRQNLFSGLWCIVLDDIGTGAGAKCDFDALPPEMLADPSWQIESSPDNFQFGFMLDEPIRDLNVARDFVRIVYNAGAWDSGGALPNKMVRLPCGINLKEKYADENGMFKVGLVCANDYVYSPDEILTFVNAGVTFDDIQAGAVGKLDPRKRRGATAWRQGVYYEQLDGVVDDVLEYLNGREMVVNEGPEWIDVVCPWADEHSEGGGNTAGYKPLGVGDTPDRRGFHCFHDHCKDKRTGDFLKWVAEEGGPEAGVLDPVPALVAKYALDISTNEFINMQSTTVHRLKNAGFKTGHQRDVWYSGSDGKIKRATEYGLIIKSPGLLRLAGSIYEPGGEPVIERDVGKLVNNWSVPRWDLQRGDLADFDYFVDFIKYLMPNDDGAEFFLNHLASKVQSPKYRGPCIVLTTPAYGTGRGALEEILGKLWGSCSLATVGLGELLNGFAGEHFNDWMRSVWTLVPEAKESAMSRRVEARAYEDLKKGVDPRPTTHLVKEKYGGQSTEKVYCSYIICSNHADVLNIPVTDRRFKFVRCTASPASADYFNELEAWKDGDTWCAGVWAGLKARDISGWNSAVRREVTEAELYEHEISAMRGQSELDQLVTAALSFADRRMGGVISPRWVTTVIEPKLTHLGIHPNTSWKKIVEREIRNATEEMAIGDYRPKMRHEFGRFRLRYLMSTTGRDAFNSLDKKTGLDPFKPYFEPEYGQEMIEYIDGMLTDMAG